MLIAGPKNEKFKHSFNYEKIISTLLFSLMIACKTDALEEKNESFLPQNNL